jgi:hypothetical protein
VYLAPIMDEPPLKENSNNTTVVFVQDAQDVGNGQLMVYEKIADRQSSFGDGIQRNRVRRLSEGVSLDLEPISFLTFVLCH